jgi:hypothetical protein
MELRAPPALCHLAVVMRRNAWTAVILLAAAGRLLDRRIDHGAAAIANGAAADTSRPRRSSRRAGWGRDYRKLEQGHAAFVRPHHVHPARFQNWWALSHMTRPASFTAHLATARLSSSIASNSKLRHSIVDVEVETGQDGPPVPTGPHGGPPNFPAVYPTTWRCRWPTKLTPS